MGAQELIGEILMNTKTIAVVGLSPKAHRTSHSVSEYMQKQGYKIIPVYPREETILGEKVYRSVSEIPGKIDTVLVFRRSEDAESAVDDAILKKPAYIWMQKGIVNEKAAKKAEKEGIKVVMDRCMYVEHGKFR
ncbi:MAG TPA: CoA-binding protein [Firmicutes bacterium]|nr:CoA-binding protein [Bacillota bacterium]